MADFPRTFGLTPVLLAGLALLATGGALMTWFVVKRHSGSGDWQISIEGNRILTEKEISDVVTYLLRAAKDGVSSDEIRDALLLNTRIESAKVTVLPGRKITIRLSERTLGFAKPDAIVMHPGPINRGVELAPQVADSPRAVILQQVSWGVAIRMAVLERAVHGDAGPPPAPPGGP